MKSNVLLEIQKKFNERSWLYRMKIHWQVLFWNLPIVGIKRWVNQLSWCDLNPRYKV